MKLAISPQDPRWVFLSETPPGLSKHMNKIPQYQLLPNFRGIPRPEVFLFQRTSTISYCSAGLWKEVHDWCIENKIECTKPTGDMIHTNFPMNKEAFRDYVKNWHLNVEPRDYQVDAAWLILNYKRSMSLLATRSGKTLIGYIVFRAAMEILGVHKILMIVPSIQLVRQGLEDFKEYAEFFNGEEVWEKGEHVQGANLTIGTFQSLVLRADRRSKRYNPSFFNDYDMVLVDECHKLKAKSIQTILEQPFMKTIKIGFGFTGTLPKPNTIDHLCCQAMMGPKIQDISTIDLVNRGFLVEPVIKQIRLSYNKQSYEDILIECAEYLIGNYKLIDGKKILRNKEDRRMTMIHVKELPTLVKKIQATTSKTNYIEYLINLLKDASQLLVLEQMITQRSKPHIDIIDSILRNTPKNMIVFAHNTEYISFLVKHFKEAFPDRNIYKITGSNSLKERQEVLDNMLRSDNNILVGSYGCVSTGLTFKHVAGMIMAQSFKSHLINIQSIGRLLLPENDKSEAFVYDIIDTYNTKRIYNQGLSKIRDYNEYNYKYSIETRDVMFEDIYT